MGDPAITSSTTWRIRRSSEDPASCTACPTLSRIPVLPYHETRPVPHARGGRNVHTLTKKRRLSTGPPFRALIIGDRRRLRRTLLRADHKRDHHRAVPFDPIHKFSLHQTSVARRSLSTASG